MKLSSKKRRAVGGLISLIGLLSVFTISSLAFLLLNSEQASLIAVGNQIDNVNHDRNSEDLEIVEVLCYADNFNQTSIIDISLNNKASKNSKLDAILLINKSPQTFRAVTDSGYFPDDTVIPAITDDHTISILSNMVYNAAGQGFTEIESAADQITLLSNHGNTFSINHDFATQSASSDCIAAPSPPLNLQVTSVSDQTVSLSWSEPEDLAITSSPFDVFYFIEVKSNSDDLFVIRNQTTVNATTNFDVMNLVNDVEYQFRVRAITSESDPGYGTHSDVVVGIPTP